MGLVGGHVRYTNIASSTEFFFLKFFSLGSEGQLAFGKLGVFLRTAEGCVETTTKKHFHHVLSQIIFVKNGEINFLNVVCL